MRKIGLIVLVGVLVGAFAMSAHAVTLPSGILLQAKFGDWSSLYDSGTGVALATGVLPTGGDEGRAIGYVTNITDKFSSEVWNPVTTGSELTFSEYDFVLPGSSVQGYIWNAGTASYVALPATGGVQADGSIYFIPGPAYGGLIDIWEDTTKDWTATTPPTKGPNAWVADVGSMDYPGLSDIDIDGLPDAGVTLWLRGTYVPLFYDGNLNSIREVGEMDLVVFDIDGDGLDGDDDVAAIYGITGYSPFGVGKLTAYIDVFAGSYLNLVDQDMWDVSGSAYDYDIFLAGELSPTDGTGWGVTSHDPAKFRVIPEPATMSLLGLGIVGLVGYARRKRK